jgi:hypothetical protein
VIAVLVSDVLKDYQDCEAHHFQRTCDVNVELREVEVGVVSAFVIASFCPEAVGLQEFSFGRCKWLLAFLVLFI